MSNHALDPARLSRSRWGRNGVLAFAAVLVAGLLGATTPARPAAADGSSCGPTVNAIVCENQKPGTPESVWDDIDGSGDPSIQGFATDISVDAGQTEQFKIDTDAGAYTIDIYRLGYYGGDGARKIASVTPSAQLPQHQPACATDPSTTLYDCGTWAVSASWSVPSTAVSGVYLAKLTRTDTKGGSQIPFIVRNDASTSDIIFQTSDPTWEAYNRYGGANFYTGSETNMWESQSRARKLSYNRPFATRGDWNGRDYLFSNEYPTIRFLERNGYDVSYMAGVDTDRHGNLLTNHKVFLSVGHDEYWSQAQRTNVEKARDAGVSLMFLSGNEVYWHTRYEPSIDGNNTAYRTLVDYKETWDNAATDPTGESTATWRDPRFSNAPGGANPENGLTGTMYFANDVDLPITVTSGEGRTRLWRNTGLGSMSGASTELAPHTVGYESDEDADNGFRPAGLIDLSTTVGPTSQYLTDFGNTVVAGTTTHHVTLYRAPSGALVFSAGSIQWAWGLDEDHDGSNAPADPRMQQATINMLADMHVQPTTLMSGMVAASASSDTQAPVSKITSPAAGSSIPDGTQITVEGTATDSGGGVVAGVEVSLDGGSTWHPATGTTSWSYTGIVHGNGQVTIKSRATDDSANIEQNNPGITVSMSCPCTLFGSTVPTQPDSGDGSATELGVRFTSSQNGYITGIRFYKSSQNSGTHTGTLWSATGTKLASGTFTNETASGWQTLTFADPVQITKGTVYVASYFAPVGHYSDTPNFFYYRDYGSGPLSAPPNTPNESVGNGVFASRQDAFPSQTYQGSNYYVDPVFMDAANLPPGVSATTPTDGAGGVATSVHPTATFSKDVTPSSIDFTLKDVSGNTVAGNVSYDSATSTATFTPAKELDTGSFYSASVTATDTSGKPMPAPATWSFSTTTGPLVPEHCPCTFWDDAATPATVTEPEGSAVELGTMFSTDTSGVITGVRFYKGPQNTGVHTVSLWTQTGTELATATVTSESNSGWQQASFSSPVAVTAGTTYVVSYHTSTGYYSATESMFASAGVDAFPLHIPVQGGVYAYGTGGFPSRSSSSNYWVEPVFTVPNSVVPTVNSKAPADGDTGVRTGSKITATFNTAVRSGTASISLSSASGQVAGTTTLNATHDVLTFTPSNPMAQDTRYSVSATGGVSLSGTNQAAANWSFTTGGPGSCPCSLFSTGDAPTLSDAGADAPLTLGVQFTSNVDGYVSGVRFYKSPANTGTHVGALWSASGTKLAQATFSNETTSGWQTVPFSQPVPITAGTTYVASYSATGGHYAADLHFFDNAWTNAPLTAPVDAGVFTYSASGFPNQSYQGTNYWVDAIVGTGTGTDSVPPSVSGTTPLNGSTSQSTGFKPTATFSEPVTSDSVTFTLTTGSGMQVSGTTTYDSASKTATFRPDSVLAAGTTYTAEVSASDTSGNAMKSPYSWSFTTATGGSQPGVCPCSVWDDTATPSILNATDNAQIEVGMKFTSDQAGQVTAIRFYKGASNTGPHKVSLWSADGQLLGSGTSTNESTSGWQKVALDSPVNITAGTTYVVSYHSDSGYYSATLGSFSSAGVDSPPLHVPAHGAMYLYGSGFPSNSSDNNYWVDPVVQTSTDTTFTNTTIADFSSGTAASTYVAANGDGEVVLQPGSAAEFSGTAVPSGWSSTAAVRGGNTTVAGGTATLSGARLVTSATYSKSRSFETLATLGVNQTISWATTNTGSSIKGSFSVNSSGQLVAGVDDGLSNNASAVAVSGWTAAPHRLRIDWTSSGMTFYVDGVQKYTHAFAPLLVSKLRPEFYDSALADANLSVDWVRIAPYSAAGTFTSAVLDDGKQATWNAVTWSVDLPAGTTLTVKVRTGNTPAPDATWSVWTAIPNSGANAGQSARYAQYRLSLTSASPQYVSPAVRSVQLVARA